MQRDDPLAGSELTYLLGLGFQLILVEFMRRLDAAGYTDLRPVHGLVFAALRGTGATATEVADRLGISKQAAAQLVDDLERSGYVRREPHPQGGRRRLVMLTDKGDRHLLVAARVLHGLEAELGRRLGDPDLGGLRSELVRLVRDLAGDHLPPMRPVW